MQGSGSLWSRGPLPLSYPLWLWLSLYPRCQRYAIIAGGRERYRLKMSVYLRNDVVTPSSVTYPPSRHSLSRFPCTRRQTYPPQTSTSLLSLIVPRKKWRKSKEKKEKGSFWDLWEKYAIWTFDFVRKIQIHHYFVNISLIPSDVEYLKGYRIRKEGSAVFLIW